jgi:RNA-directed DNA polymerase
LRKFLEYRIGDKRIIRLILKWLKVGYVENGKRSRQTIGTAQGAVISPLLANIYLHYTLDLWVEQWRRHNNRGKVYIVRYADDFVVCFQYKDEAHRFTTALQERLEKFALQLHPDKTRLIEFGRYAAQNREKRGERKPETIDFLGFTHICSRNRKGDFMVRRHTISKRFRRKVREVKYEMRRQMHCNVKEVGMWLRKVIIGYQNYYAVPTNLKNVKRFRDCIVKAWIKVRRRRSQKARSLTWEVFARRTEKLLPRVKQVHPFPSVRFYAIHPR